MLSNKRICSLILVFVFMFVSLGYYVDMCKAADVDVDKTIEQSVVGKSLRKGARGLLNLCFSWIEVPQTACEVGREEGVPAGATYGVFKGFLFAFVRIAVGAYELATFPLPFPADYEPILKEPEFYPGDGEGLK